MICFNMMVRNGLLKHNIQTRQGIFIYSRADEDRTNVDIKSK